MEEEDKKKDSIQAGILLPHWEPSDFYCSPSQVASSVMCDFGAFPLLAPLHNAAESDTDEDNRPLAGQRSPCYTSGGRLRLPWNLI